MEISHFVEIFKFLRKFTDNPLEILKPKVKQEIDEIINEVLFARNIEFLELLENEISLIVFTLRHPRKINIDNLKFLESLDIRLSIIRSFISQMRALNIISAVEQIKDGKNVLKIINEYGNAGISNYDLLRKVKKIGILDASELERILVSLENIRLIRRIEEYLFIQEQGKKIFL